VCHENVGRTVLVGAFPLLGGWAFCGEPVCAGLAPDAVE